MTLQEAFESFCNKSVGTSSSAELMASFCDNLLKKGGSEKLSDEAIEDTLDKARLCCMSARGLCSSLVLRKALVGAHMLVKPVSLCYAHAQVVKLLAYISDKDLFAEFYRKKLSRCVSAL